MMKRRSTVEEDVIDVARRDFGFGGDREGARVQRVQLGPLGRTVVRSGGVHAGAHAAAGGHEEERHAEHGTSASPGEIPSFDARPSYAEQLLSGRWMDRYGPPPDLDAEIQAAARRPRPTGPGVEPLSPERQAEVVRQEGQLASNRPWAPFLYALDRDKGSNWWDLVEGAPELARSMADSGRRALESVNLTPRWARREMQRQANEAFRDAPVSEEIVVTARRLDPITKRMRRRERAEETGRNIGAAIRDVVLGPWDGSRDAAEAQARARFAGDKTAARRARTDQLGATILSGLNLSAPVELGAAGVQSARAIPRGVVEDATLARLRADAIAEAAEAQARRARASRRP